MHFAFLAVKIVFIFHVNELFTGHQRSFDRICERYYAGRRCKYLCLFAYFAIYFRFFAIVLCLPVLRLEFKSF